MKKPQISASAPTAPSAAPRLLRTAADLSAHFRPDGYPQLLLSAVGENFVGRTPLQIQKRVEKIEQHHATPLFHAHGFTALMPNLAAELASVYLSLRQHYPGVIVDKLNVAWAPTGKYRGLAGLTITRDSIGTLRELAYAFDEPRLSQVLLRLDEIDDPEVRRRARKEYRDELRSDPRFIHELFRLDTRAHGTISLNESLAHPSCLKSLENFRLSAHHATPRNRHGELLYPATLTSEATYLMVHEFSHMVDIVLADLGPDAVKRVWSTLDDILLRYPSGGWRISATTLAEHDLTRRDARLTHYPINYSTATTALGVRDDVRKVVGHEVAMTLGVYAATDRWELFAEALTYAYISRDPVLRARLAPLRQVLCELGLGRKSRRAFT